MTRHPFIRGFSFAVLAMLVAACTSSTGGASPTAGQASAAPPTTEASAPAASGGAAGEPIKIGGGFALGLCADVILLARESRYGCTFMNLGFTPGMGTTSLLEHVLSTAARSSRAGEA